MVMRRSKKDCNKEHLRDANACFAMPTPPAHARTSRPLSTSRPAPNRSFVRLYGCPDDAKMTR